MIYFNASELFRDRFNRDELIPLFRDLRSRDINPEIWDKQIKYWSSFISKWGSQFNVVDFSVNQLTQALEYHDFIPHIQPSIDNLTKSHVLLSRDSFLTKKKSFIKSFASKLFGYINPSNQQQCDVYIFVNNIKILVKKIISDVEISETLSTDVVLTNDEIKKKYCQEVDFEYLKIMLEDAKEIKTYKNGFYFQTGRYSSLSDDVVNAILNSKIILKSISKRLTDVENEIKTQLNKAREYKVQNKKAQAINCLKKKKILESQESKLTKMHDDMSNILSKLSENELTKAIVNSINQIHMSSKNMQMPNVEDIENVMDELGEQMVQSDELSNALATSNLNQIDDFDIENEFDELMDDDDEQPTFKFTEANNPAFIL